MTSFIFILLQTILPLWQDSLISQWDLPVVRIETVNQENPTFDVVYRPDSMACTIANATKVPARMVITYRSDTLYDSGEYIKDKSGLTIKVRGNQSSVQGSKPSYKLKLQKKAELLGRDATVYKDKDWILVKESQLRFREGLLVNRLMGMDWTPAYQYCNVVFNGKIKGLYMLMEAVKVADYRVPAGPDGFLAEYDAYYWNEPYYVPSSYYFGYTYKDPDYADLLPDVQPVMDELIAEMDASFAAGEQEKYIDIESFAKWILAQDIIGQGDAAGSNLYFYRTTTDSTSRFRVPTLWDFDAAEATPDGFCNMHNAQMFGDLFAHSDTFVQTYIQLWDSVSPFLFDSVIAHFEAYKGGVEAIALDSARQMNAAHHISVNNWPDHNTTVAEDADRVIAWMTNRKLFLTQAIDELREDANHPTDIQQPLQQAPRKIIKDGRIWIYRDNEVYDIFGLKIYD